MNERINSNIPKPNEPPVENKQNNDVPQEETFSFPSPEEMGDLLKEADKMATEALVTEEEIGKRVNEREKQVEQLRYLRAFEEYLKWLGQLSPMENLNPGDYGALAEEKIIDRDSKDPLQKRILENMDTVLYRFQSIKSLSPDEAQTLAKLFTIREKFREEIKRRILEEQNRISTRRGEIIERTLAVYKRRTRERRVNKKASGGVGVGDYRPADSPPVTRQRRRIHVCQEKIRRKKERRLCCRSGESSGTRSRFGKKRKSDGGDKEPDRKRRF